MYKCKECGTEFDTKPEYCDCGNDTFDVVAAPEKAQKTTPAPEVKVDTNQEPQKSEKVSKSVYEDDYDRFKKFFDPVSTIIFILCILAGLSVIFFVGNPSEKVVQNQPDAVSQNQDLPSVDSFWENSSPEPKVAEPEPEPEKPEPQPNFIQKIIQPVVQQKQSIKTASTQSQNTVKQQSATQVQKVSQPQKPVQTQKNTAQIQSSQTTVKSQSNTQTSAVKTPSDADLAALTQRVQANANAAKNKSQNQNTSSVKPQTVTATQTATQTAPTLRSTTQTQSQTSTQPQAQNVAQTVQPAVDTAKLKQELANYKVNLRNTIGRKINFANVVGDGNCTVSFKISPNGQLTNRVFAQQSSNITLNDAVYSAVASTPSFSAPPSGYKNETLNLKVTFYNGNFDITLY